MDIAITLITSSPGSAKVMPGVRPCHEPEHQNEAEPSGACNKAEPCYKNGDIRVE